MDVHLDKDYSYVGMWQQNTNNLAVLQLEHPFEFNEFIGVACLDARPGHEQTYYTIITFQMVSWRVPVNETAFRGPAVIAIHGPDNKCWDTIQPEGFWRPGSSLLCTLSNSCGHSNDIGAGAFTQHGGRYYIRALMDPPPKFGTYMPCTSRMHTSIIPNLEFIQKAMFKYNPVDEIIDDMNEKDNEKKKCGEYSALCDDGKCISQFSVCNNRTECEDASDESSLLCSSEVERIFPNCGLYKSNSTNPYPWHIGVWRETETIPQRICSGTIITPTVVISAVDCFRDELNNTWSRDDFTITAGYVDNHFQQHRSVVKVLANKYKHYTKHKLHKNNIALVFVDTPFSFDITVMPACLTRRFTSPLYNEDPDIHYISWTNSGFQIRNLYLIRNFYCQKNTGKYFAPDDDDKICSGNYKIVN